MKTTAGESEATAHVWAAVEAQLRKTRLGQEIQYFLVDDGDNPLYYGDVSLTIFSLEHINVVCDDSIEDARKRVKYFLEMAILGEQRIVIRCRAVIRKYRYRP